MMKNIICSLLLITSSIVALSQKNGFSGKITGINNAAIPFASIHLLNSNQVTLSDSTGAYSFKNLSAGRYEVQVSSAGYNSLNSQVQVNGNTKGSIDFVLQEYGKLLEPVLVSAEKREAFQQKVPLSLTVINARKTAEMRLWNSSELTAIVPNLYSASSGDDRNVTGIRGIATTSYDPAVATYIDGVNQFSLDTYMAPLSDIERIEVLRGPQGTLYGRNAMGGVINIITKQPGNRTEGFAEASIGNYGLQRYNAGFRIPLLKNKLFLGGSGLFSKLNGYYTNTYNNSDFDKQNSFAGNYSLKWVPCKKWALTLNVKHLRNRNNGPFPLVNGVNEAFQDPYVLNQNAISKMNDNSFNSSLAVNHSGKYFNLSALTAFQSNYRYYEKPLDGDFSPIDGVTVINNYGDKWNKVKVFTQELKFSNSAASASRLTWTAGAYFFYQDNPAKQATHFGNDALLVGAPDVNFSVINSSKGKSTGIAFFGQQSYAFSRKFSVIAGLRYDYEKKKYNILGQYQKDPDPNPLFDTRPDTSATASFNALSPKLGVAYIINSSSNVFLTYSRGYRTGGLTPLTSDPSQPPLYPYDPEYSNNIEAGIKNTLAGNRLQLNVTVFYTNISNAQVPTLILPDAVTITKNAGRLNSAGIELELSARPVKGLQADYNFGYTHATYSNLKLSQYGTEMDLKGKRQLFTPEETSMLALQYDLPVSRNRQINITARAEWFYMGRQYFDLSNSIRQNGYSLFNTRFGISSKYLSLMFWGRNLSNKKFIAYAYDFGAIHLGTPFTFGTTLSCRF